MICGNRIQVSPGTPKMTLSKDVPVSPEFRLEMDTWMLGFFGTFNAIPDGVTYQLKHQNVLVMNPRTYAALRKVLKEKP